MRPPPNWLFVLRYIGAGFGTACTNGPSLDFGALRTLCFGEPGLL